MSGLFTALPAMWQRRHKVVIGHDQTVRVMTCINIYDCIKLAITQLFN